MAIAIIETGGKQYRVSEGDVIFVEKLPQEAEATITFDKVLAVLGETNTFGTPVVKGATVTGSLEKTGKSKKIIVYKMHAKKGYHKKQGHRQPYSRVKIDKINF